MRTGERGVHSPCTLIRHWGAVPVPYESLARVALRDGPAGLPPRGRVRSQWLGVCVQERAEGTRGRGFGSGDSFPLPTRTTWKHKHRAGVTCGEAQPPRRGVDGPCWLRGLRCGAITTGLERSLPCHCRAWPWPWSCTPLRPPTNKTRRAVPSCISSLFFLLFIRRFCRMGGVNVLVARSVVCRGRIVNVVPGSCGGQCPAPVMYVQSYVAALSKKPRPRWVCVIMH